jgi:hypothetical protein
VCPVGELPDLVGDGCPEGRRKVVSRAGKDHQTGSLDRLGGGTGGADAKEGMEQRRAGQDTTQWQSELAAHLSQIAAAGHNPHLTAALTDTPSIEAAGWQDSLFERAMIRILAGLLPPYLCRS